MTYDDLIDYFKKKIDPSDTRFSLFVRNLGTKREYTILNGTKKRYNWAYIIYDPNGYNPCVVNQGPFDERSYYYCNTIEDALEIGNFLLEHIDTWITTINQDDMLEQRIYDN